MAAWQGYCRRGLLRSELNAAVARTPRLLANAGEGNIAAVPDAAGIILIGSYNQRG